MRVAKIVPFLLLAAACRSGQGPAVGAPGSASPGPTPLESLPRDEAGALVRRAIHYAGGWRAWAAKTTVAYRQSERRFAPDGSVEQEREESVRVRFQPAFGVRIEWGPQDTPTILVNNGRFTTKVTSASEDFSAQAEHQSRSQTLGAYFALALPFVLADRGVGWKDRGQAPLPDGKIAQRLRVTVLPNGGNLGDFATRTYFFVSSTGRLAQTLVPTASGGYELIELLDEKTIDGLRLATKRKTYQSDENGKRGALLAESSLHDVHFNPAFESSTFDIPVH